MSSSLSPITFTFVVHFYAIIMIISRAMHYYLIRAGNNTVGLANEGKAKEDLGLLGARRVPRWRRGREFAEFCGMLLIFVF